MTLVSTPPHGGVPVGDGDWWFTVELAYPTADASLYGTAVYGVDVYTDLDWSDITEHVEGMSWDRGSDTPGDRPADGTATVMLRNLTGEWSPWRNIYYGPGTMLRASVHNSDGEWIPQFTGTVETWGYASAGTYRYQRVEITLSETIGALGAIDRNAGPLVGAGETSGARVRRLLDDAVWQHGSYDEARSPITLQSTDMANNRLTELHLTADSADVWFRSHRSGVAMLEAQDPADHPEYSAPGAARYGAAVYGTATYSGGIDLDWSTVRAASYFYRRFELRPDSAGVGLPDALGRSVCRLAYSADSIEPTATDEIVVNEANFANAGGNVQTALNEASQGRFGVRPHSRHDLKTQHQADVLTLAQRVVARRSERSLNLGSVELHGANDNLPGLFVVDVGDQVTVVLPDYWAFNGHIAGIHHEIVAMVPGESLNWRASLAIETFEEPVEPAVIGGAA